MPYDHAWEKFFNAVRYLAAGYGTIQERLCDACIHGLGPLLERENPPEILEDFRNLQDQITKIKPTGSEGSIPDTIAQMTTGEAGNVAENIVSIFNRIATRRD